MITGFLHPGAMGASIAAVCHGQRLWAGNGRSAATHARAEEAGLTDVGTIDELTRRADTVISVCPPGSALAVADEVAAAGFNGLFIDVNAIAPATARVIGQRFDRFVDGGIIGPPTGKPGTTRLYLCGDEAATVADLWSDSVLETRLVPGEIGAASAVKACFASWTKGTAALLLAIRALARAEKVEDSLLAEWSTSLPELITQSQRNATSTAPKAWRFVGEMHELAEAFTDANLPSGFMHAAAQTYARLDQFKDASGVTVEQVIDALRYDPSHGT